MTGSDAEAGHPPGDGGAGEVGDEQAGPVGTLFLLMVYVMVLAGMWGTMYWILVSR